MLGKKITVFLTNGNEYGPKIVQIGNWDGKALYTPKKSATTFLSREEFKDCGIYILKSVSDDDKYAENVYIGEAEQLDKRIKQHLQDSDKDFSEILVFTSKALTKSHVKYLESRLIQLARSAKTANITNINQTSLTYLLEADVSDMEYFLEQIKLILPLMGYKLLIETALEDSKLENDTNKTDVEQGDNYTYYIKENEKRITATMIESDRGFIVLKGSYANKDEATSLSDIYKELRQKLIADRILVDSGEYYRFEEDIVFNSISRASNVVLGRQTNGHEYWLTKKGITYKENQRKLYSSI